MTPSTAAETVRIRYWVNLARKLTKNRPGRVRTHD